MFFLSLLLLGLLPLTISSDDIIVHTPAGKVVGRLVKGKAVDYELFPGIPYAESPAEKLRFKKPQPFDPSGRQAVNSYHNDEACVQYYPHEYPWNRKDILEKNDENCLYLDVFRRRQKAGKNVKKAVMFWIHGGGLSTGYGLEEFGDVFAVHGDVILVTVDYRLGIFGFLSTETEDAPGNMGLFDVLAALKWVNENIEPLGGDKNRITVFGQGAGSIISVLLTISPLAKGLFQRIILESGVPYLTKNPFLYNSKLTQYTADAVGCSTEDLVPCLRSKDSHYLAKVVNSFNPSNLRTFLPIFEDDFLPIQPLIALKAGAFEGVDVLAGVVQDEGSIELVTAFSDIFGPYGEKDPKINKTLGRDIILQILDPSPFSDRIADHYLSDVDDDDYDTIRKRVYHAVGDYWVVCPTLKLLEIFSQKKVKTYMYYFFHKTSTNTPFQPWMGVTRYSEVPFVFGLDGRKVVSGENYTREEHRLSNQMIKMWTDFAKKGVPSSKWKEYSEEDPYIQNFYINSSDTDKSTLKEHLDNCKFLKQYLVP